MGDLDDLIRRLESATEGSRELDWAIAEYLGEVPKHHIMQVGWDYDWYRNSDREWTLWRAKDSEGRSIESWQPKSRTRSLDAALTLVPEGWNWNLMGPDVLKVNPAVALLGLPCQREVIGKAKTPALALCIAALRIEKGK